MRTFDYQNLHVTPGYVLDLLRIRPHVIVTNEMGARTIIALAYGSLFRVPVLVWWGGTLHTEAATGLARRLTRRVIARWARHWISYGRSSTDYLLELGVPKERVVEAQNQVDNGLFHRTGRQYDRTSPPVLLCVGQLVGRKGVDRFLEAAASLQSQGESFSVLIVGSGPERVRLETSACDLGLKDVTFLGAVAPESMPAVYASADCLIFPTLSDVWGLVVNEALWTGLPVLCSRYAGCAEELLPGENIFDPNDERSFKDALRRAVRGQIAPADLSRLRTIEDVARSITDAISRVVTRRS